MSDEWREGEGDMGMSRYGGFSCRPVLALLLALLLCGALAAAAGVVLLMLGARDADARRAAERRASIGETETGTGRKDGEEWIR
jgi:hypothetical protein